jgi:hypothetical protein
MSVYRFSDQSVVGTTQFVTGIISELCSDSRRLDHVGEQNRRKCAAVE